MKRGAGVIAQCQFCDTGLAKKLSTYEKGMLCVYPGSTDFVAVVRAATPLFQPAGTWSIANRYRYRVSALSCA